MPSRLTSRLLRSGATAAVVLAASGGAYAVAADRPSSRGEPSASAAQAGLPRAFGRFTDAPLEVPGGGDKDMASLRVPSGSFVHLAKAVVRQEAGRSMSCRLRVDGDFDKVDLRTFGEPVRHVFTLTVLHASSFSTSAFLTCNGPSGQLVNGTLRDIKLTAVEVGSISNKSANAP